MVGYATVYVLSLYRKLSPIGLHICANKYVSVELSRSGQLVMKQLSNIVPRWRNVLIFFGFCLQRFNNSMHTEVRVRSRKYVTEDRVKDVFYEVLIISRKSN